MLNSAMNKITSGLQTILWRTYQTTECILFIKFTL